MINLLYIILIAMLAINISSDVLDGSIRPARHATECGRTETYNSVLSKAAADRGMAEQHNCWKDRRTKWPD